MAKQKIISLETLDERFTRLEAVIERGFAATAGDVLGATDCAAAAGAAAAAAVAGAAVWSETAVGVPLGE